MTRVVNITDKLNFNENPALVIGDIKAEVNADAEAMLKLMGVFTEKSNLEAVQEALGIIFKPKDMEAICKLEKDGKKLSASSLMTLIEAAMNLVMGEGGGEQ